MEFTRKSMLARLACLLVVFLFLSETRAADNVGLTLTVSGPSLLWEYAVPSDNEAIITALQTDVKEALDVSTGVTIKSLLANDTALFVTMNIEGAGDERTIKSKLYATSLKQTQLEIKNYINTNKKEWLPFVRPSLQFYTALLPGALTPNSSRSMSQTAVDLHVLLSGNSNVWPRVITATNFRATLENAICESIAHPGVITSCQISAMTPIAATTSKTEYGNGESGLLVNVMVNQVYRDSDAVVYYPYECSASVTSMNTSDITAAYVKVSKDKTKISVLYTYFSAGSIIQCSGLCIAAMTLVVAVFYLSLIIVILACISIKCYKLKSVDVKIPYDMIKQYGKRMMNKRPGRYSGNPCGPPMMMQ